MTDEVYSSVGFVRLLRLWWNKVDIPMVTWSGTLQSTVSPRILLSVGRKRPAAYSSHNYSKDLRNEVEGSEPMQVRFLSVAPIFLLVLLLSAKCSLLPIVPTSPWNHPYEHR